MKTPTISRNVRLTLMAVTIVAIAAFGIFGAGWATAARADNSCGTVPCAPSAATGPGGPCGSGAQTFTLTEPTNVTNPPTVTKLLDVGIGTVMLLSNEAGIGTGAVRPLFVPISMLTVNLIAPELLHGSPAGWTNLGCGIRNSAIVSDGQAATFVRKGQQVCFVLPVGAAAAYKNLRIAYWDTGLARWVFLNTTVGAIYACHSSFRLLPTTFALFGGA
jgi:hypothetical protein